MAELASSSIAGEMRERRAEAKGASRHEGSGAGALWWAPAGRGARAGRLLWALLLLSVYALPVVAPPRVPSVGEWAGIRAMKFLKCRYYRYDRSGRDVCEGDSIEDLRKAISDMSDTFKRLPRRLAAAGSLFALTWGFATRHMGIPGRGHGKVAFVLFWVLFLVSLVILW